MNYLIVGASSGLGRDLAYKFAENSHNLILISRDLRDLEVIKSDIESRFNTKVTIYKIDCSSYEELDNFLKLNQDFFNNVDGVLFPIGMVDEEDNISNVSLPLNKLLFANYSSILKIAFEANRVFIKKNKGTIVGFGSVSALLGRDQNLVYSSSKRALESLFESLAIINIKNKIKIQFYVLGYLESNMTFSKKLILPKGSTYNLSNQVFKNLEKKYKKIYFPFWWIFIAYILKILPFFIIRQFFKQFKKK